MNGSSVIVLESGDECVRTHHDHGDYDHPISQNYRKVMHYLSEFAKNAEKASQYEGNAGQANFDEYY